jgi:hypothetical protein
MTDEQLRELQRHNELQAFLSYEAALRDAYARSKAEDARRRLHQNPDRGRARGLRRRGEFTSPRAAQS